MNILPETGKVKIPERRDKEREITPYRFDIIGDEPRQPCRRPPLTIRALDPIYEPLTNCKFGLVDYISWVFC